LSLTEESPDLLQTATLEPTATAVLPPSGPSPLPPTATPTQGLNPAMTPSATLTAVPPVGTGTLTATPVISATPTISATLGTGSPTPDGSTTPQATATPFAGDPKIKGTLDFEELVMSNLENGAVDSWDITLDSSDFLTVTVAPASSANMVISVIDPNGQILVDKQNQSPAAEVETISNLSIRESGTYHIQISSDPAEPSNYALMVSDNSSYEFIFRGTLNPDQQRSDSLPEDVDVFWFFTAADGENFNLEVTPNGDVDAYVELYGPDAVRLLTLDEKEAGEPEYLTDHSILASGMYAIRVGEFDFEPMIYQIIINLN
jgi:hypothetical protein